MQPGSAPLTPAEHAAITAFSAVTRSVLPTTAIEIRLFGSRARGEGNAESDLDLALIADHWDTAARRRICDAAYDIGLEHGLLLSPLFLARAHLEELRARELLFAADLDRDGIPL